LALANNASLAKPNLEATHRKLEQRRSQLLERLEALHGPRDPWGVSFFDAQCQLLGLPGEAKTELRFRGEQLERLGGPTIGQAEEDLDAYVGLGGLSLGRSASPWAAAVVVSSDEAKSLQLQVESLRDELAHLLTRLGRAAGETETLEPETISGWGALLDEWDG